MEWIEIDRENDQDIPSDVELLLGWRGFGGKWETCTDFYHSTRGGWYHGSATHWCHIPEPPQLDTPHSPASIP